MCGVQVKDRKIDGTQRSMERAMCGVQVKDIKREVTQISMESNVRSTGQRYKEMGHRDLWREQCAEYR